MGVQPASDTSQCQRARRRAAWWSAARRRRGLWPACVSISHCHGQALCAISKPGRRAIGAGYQAGRNARPGFAGDYF
jgi:hypothetical protein